MTSNKEISEELGLLSLVVAGISRQTPYQAPEGYFEGLSGAVQARIQMGGEEGGTAFQQEAIFQEKMISRETPFSVPAGYFEGFSARVLDKIRGQQGNSTDSVSPDPASADPVSSLLESIGRKMPYQVPVGYFDGLQGFIDKLSQDAETLSPMLEGLRKEQAYVVPEGYFESLPAIIQAQIAGQSAVVRQLVANTGSSSASADNPASNEGRVVRLHKKRSWLKYAVAAAVLGLVVTSGLLRLENSPGIKQTAVNTTEVAQGLSAVSDQDLENYIDLHSNQIQQEQDEALADNSSASFDITDGDVKSFLGDISDNELNEYLAEHGGSKDFSTN